MRHYCQINKAIVTWGLFIFYFSSQCVIHAVLPPQQQVIWSIGGEIISMWNLIKSDFRMCHVCCIAFHWVNFQRVWSHHSVWPYSTHTHAQNTQENTHIHTRTHTHMQKIQEPGMLDLRSLLSPLLLAWLTVRVRYSEIRRYSLIHPHY